MPVMMFLWSMFTVALTKNVLELHPIPELPPLSRPIVMCNSKQGCWEYGNGRVHRVARPGYPLVGEQP